MNSDNFDIAQLPQDLAGQMPDSGAQGAPPQSLRMRPFYYKLPPVDIDVGDYDDGSNVCYQMNDCNSVIYFDDLDVDQIRHLLGKDDPRRKTNHK